MDSSSSLTVPLRAILPSSSNSRVGSMARTVRSMKNTPSPGSMPPGTSVSGCPFSGQGGQKVTEEVPPMLMPMRHLEELAGGRSMMES